MSLPRRAADEGTWFNAALRAGFKVAIKTSARDDLVEPKRALLA